jgi:hypothetical protein
MQLSELKKREGLHPDAHAAPSARSVLEMARGNFAPVASRAVRVRKPFGQTQPTHVESPTSTVVTNPLADGTPAGEDKAKP